MSQRVRKCLSVACHPVVNFRSPFPNVPIVYADPFLTAKMDTEMLPRSGSKTLQADIRRMASIGSDDRLPAITPDQLTKEELAVIHGNVDPERKKLMLSQSLKRYAHKDTTVHNIL